MNALLLKSSTDDQGEWSKVLGSHGCQVMTATPLGFEFVNLNDLRDKLANPEGYSGIVLTSQRTVEAVAMATANSGQLDVRWTDKKPCYVVGPATAAKAGETLKWRRDLVIGQESGSAEQLVKLLPENEDKFLPLLYPCGQKETMSKYLRDMSRVDKVVAYQTGKSPHLEKELDAFPTTLDVVVFFSPSGVKYALKDLKDHKDLKHFIAIGPTTHGALVNILPEGVSLHQAESPSPEGVRRVLEAITTSAQQN